MSDYWSGWNNANNQNFDQNRRLQQAVADANQNAREWKENAQDWQRHAQKVELQVQRLQETLRQERSEAQGQKAGLACALEAAAISIQTLNSRNIGLEQLLAQSRAEARQAREQLRRTAEKLRREIEASRDDMAWLAGHIEDLESGLIPIQSGSDR